MTILTVLILLVGGIAMLRFVGFAEPIAALIVAAILVVILIGPSNPNIVGLFNINILRVDIYVGQAVLVAAIIASLLAGCHDAPRPVRPLGWYAPGDAGFFGVFPAAAVIAGIAFGQSILTILMSLVIIGLAVWLVMAVVGALLSLWDKTGKAPSVWPALGVGALGFVLVLSPALSAMALGILTSSEALTFLSLPSALVVRLVVGLVQGRGIGGIGPDLLRGVADGAWIVFAMFAAAAVTMVIGFSGSDPGRAMAEAVGVNAMSPVAAMVTIAAMVLILGMLIGSTVGAFIAAPIAASLAAMAGVSGAAPALVVALALLFSYARPSLELTLLSPAMAGGRAAPSGSFAEVAVWVAGAALMLGAAVLVAQGTIGIWSPS